MRVVLNLNLLGFIFVVVSPVSITVLLKKTTQFRLIVLGYNWSAVMVFSESMGQAKLHET